MAAAISASSGSGFHVAEKSRTQKIIFYDFLWKWKDEGWEWRITVMVICVLFGMDFMLAKKLYEVHARVFSLGTWLTVFAVELVTLGALFQAYRAAKVPSKFFGFLAVFAIAGAVFYWRVLKAPGSELVIPIVGAVSCGIFWKLARKDSYSCWSRIGTAVVLVLTILDYSVGVARDRDLSLGMSVAGQYPYPQMTEERPN